MNKEELKQLIKHIVTESFTPIKEAHEHGEWWIDETGEITYCDNTVVDSGHEYIVMELLTREILSHFDIDVDEPAPLSEYEESIKEILIGDERLDDEELAGWDNMNGAKYRGPVEVIIKKLIEDGVYKNPKQAEDAVFIAYRSSSRDARDYAMKYWRWKIMKTHGTAIEIQTWNLQPDDLSIIVRGIWDIITDDSDEVEEDGYSGPRVNVTVQASGKRFSNIPLSVLEKKMPQNLHNYQSGVHVGYTENIK